MPLVKLMGDLSASNEKPGMGRMIDSMIFLRSLYGRPVKGQESRRRTSKNTRARCRVPPSEASDLKEHCELEKTFTTQSPDRGNFSKTGAHIAGVSSCTLRTLCRGPTAVLSMRLRILQNSEGELNRCGTKKIGVAHRQSCRSYRKRLPFPPQVSHRSSRKAFHFSPSKEQWNLGGLKHPR